MGSERLVVALFAALVTACGSDATAEPESTNDASDADAPMEAAVDAKTEARVDAADATSDAAETTCAPTSGTALYVSPTGDDANPGTEARPWKTIQKAMNAATPGSIVDIEAGTYVERLTLNVSGTAGNVVTFQPRGFSACACGGITGVACGGDAVVLDYASLGTITDGVPFLAISGKSYVRIQGLVFQNVTTKEVGAFNQGVRIDGGSHDIELGFDRFVNNVDVGPHDGTSAFGHIRVWDAHDVWIHDDELSHIVTNYSEALTVDTGATKVLVEKNWIHDTDGIAIDVHGGASATVRGNLLEWISKKHDGTVWYDNPANAIYVDGGASTTIEGNVVRDSEWAFAVVSEPGSPACHDIVIADNVAHRNDQAGIMLGNWYSTTDGSKVYDVHVLNNTLDDDAFGFFVRPYTSSSVVWENNVVADCVTPVGNPLGWPVGTMDHDLYFGGGAPGPDAHVVTSDPRFTNAAAGDFTLKTGSPAIGAGDPSVWAGDPSAVDFAGHPRVVGGKVDLGAFQTP